MTGPLAQQFASLWAYVAPEPRDSHVRAALSVIERHVQDMETALAHTSERLDSLRRYRESQEGLPIGTLGNAVWENSPALPAREKGTE